MASPRHRGALVFFAVLVLASLALSSVTMGSFVSATPAAPAAPAGLHAAAVGVSKFTPAGAASPAQKSAATALGLHAKSLLAGTHSDGAASALSASGRSSYLPHGPVGYTGTLVGKQVVPLTVRGGPAPKTASGGPGWEGINSTTSECGCAPPDVILAVGPTDVVEMNNLEMRVWTTSGTFVTNASLWTFWNAQITPSASISDPRIIYDNLTGLWYASLFDISTDSVLLGGSTTSNPLGGWLEYNIPAYTNEFPDQPYIGVSQWMIGISANDFNLTTSALDGTGYEVVNRTDFLSGHTYYYADNPTLWLPNGRAESALTPSAVQPFGGINVGAPSVFYVNVTTAPPATPTFVSRGAFISAISTPPAAAQPGTVDLIDTSDNRAISAFWQNGLETVTFTQGTGCSPYSCIRIDQLWINNDTLRQDTGILSGAANLFYPAAAADSRGDLTIVLGYSASAYYPSVLIIGQAWNEPHTLALGEFTAVTGSASITVACNGSSVCRYGDYFGAALDPSSSYVWTGSEYEYPAVYWSTWIESAATAPLSVSVAASPPAIDAGQSVTFTATANGGEGIYSYNWTTLPAGCTNSHVSTVTCTPSAPGPVSVAVNASDSFPTNASGVAPFTVNADPTLAAPTASKAAADVGQTVTFTSATPVGGTPTFTYSWAGLPAGCGAATASSVVCTFTTSGPLSLIVTATDSVTMSAISPTFSYTVSPALVVGAPTATPASANTGATITLAVTATGGSGGDSYVWAGLPTGCSTSNAASITCVSTAAGKYNVTVTVTDSNGASVTSAKTLVTVTTPASTGLFGLPGATGWILLAVIIVAVVALILVLLMRRRKPSATAPPAWQPGPSPPPAGGPPPGAAGEVPPGVGGYAPPPPPPPA